MQDLLVEMVIQDLQAMQLLVILMAGDLIQYMVELPVWMRAAF